MFEEIKNLKDSQKDTSSVPALYGVKSFHSRSYTKTNKLIIALYMVTDIMDKDEPLRSKLRTLGTDIISDMIALKKENMRTRITEVLSFLDIASAINLISEMNCSILKKEFTELEESTTEPRQGLTLSEFFMEDSKGHSNSLLISSKGHKKEHTGTRIGVQKGSTLMKALSNMEVSDRTSFSQSKDNFDILKKQRRTEIINVIKNSPEGMSIKDITSMLGDFSHSMSEKTLQRELVSMVKDNFLNKTGEKRWSRYFLPK